MECVTWSASCRVEAPAMAVQSYPGKAGLVAVAAGEVRPGSVGADAALWCLHFSLPLFFSPPCASLNARIDSLSSATAICGDCFSYWYLLSR